MATTNEILAKLGIDTTSVPKDLQNASQFFNKFANEVEAKGANAGAGFGDKFSKGVMGKIGGGSLATGIATALGLNVNKIADSIAGAIVGGNEQGWKDAETSLDNFAKLAEERLKKSLSAPALEEQLKRELKKAEQALIDFAPKKTFAQGLGLGPAVNAEQLKQEAELKTKVLQIQIDLDEVQRKNAADQKKFIEDYHQEAIAALDDEGKIVEAKARQLEIERLLKDTNLSVEESRKLQIDLLKQENIVKESSKKLDDDRLEAQKKLEKEINDAWDKLEANYQKEKERIKQLADLKRSAAEQERNVQDDKNKLSDRSKLTIGELANITNAKVENPFATNISTSYGVDSDLTMEQREIKRKAQEAKDAEEKIEQLRRAGRTGEAAEAITKLDAMKSDLVKSGFAKSTEDPAAALVAQLHEDTEKLNKTLGEIRDISKGKFVSQ